MPVTHDDLPHPVPPIAYLRYKENWFFLILDQRNDVFGAIHVVGEPGFDRIRYSVNLRIAGELIAYGNQLPFPLDFAQSPELGDGRFAVRFVKAHEQIDLSLDSDDVQLAVSFTARAPMFDFADYSHANPEAVSLAEITQFASNQQSVHTQQGMHAKGQVAVKTGTLAGQSFTIDGRGYRDHSRMVRCDNLTRNHFWTGLHFPGHVFGVMSLTGVYRPNSPANCGYVWDEGNGLRSLRRIEIASNGQGPEGVPATVELHLTDIHDQPFTIVADLTRRFAHVPLHSESAGAMPFVYDIVENFAPLELKETGETGIGIVEVGWSTPAGT
jgi:hypothetical protein